MTNVFMYVQLQGSEVWIGLAGVAKIMSSTSAVNGSASIKLKRSWLMKGNGGREPSQALCVFVCWKYTVQDRNRWKPGFKDFRVR